MSEIPGDLMSIADKMAAGFLKEGSLGCDVLAGSIARALLAERERCAKIAEDFRRKKNGVKTETWDPCGRWDRTYNYEEGKERDLIAKAIRS